MDIKICLIISSKVSVCKCMNYQWCPKGHTLQLFKAMGENISFWESLVYGHPICYNWKQEAEGSIYHLASIFFVFGCMGGSGFVGLLYVYIFFALSFLCTCIWAWLDVCAADVFSWNFIILSICIIQIIHLAYQLRSVTFDKEFQEVYNSVFQPLGISLTVFRKIISYCNAEVVNLEREHCYAVQGKTPIDKLSMLVSGRIRVTVDGEFLHYIFPLQFLDSPEWDSLRPSEEGLFQVTLTAETKCRYITWRRKKLYLLFAKHRFISRLFSMLIRGDIAEKLYALNEKVFVDSGVRFDIRLPNYYHMTLSDDSHPTTPIIRVQNFSARRHVTNRP
ncbi:popeye domain-containing protein 3 [Bombina bombina]|uniref:popeye domain-containing protein 3 n=1 Tax=Bombina bombina TaxID=8345 RepID=UPI00235A7C7E|nr:popeye domain-containing protein 3 [Bombina bombina]XP_053566562.1 popeye domain-containing protein 3 [Bombina bombina]